MMAIKTQEGSPLVQVRPEAEPPGTRGLERLKRVLSAPIEELSPAPCPGCGVIMVDGYTSTYGDIYLHLRDCPVLEQNERERQLERRRQFSAQCERQRANLPADMPLDLAGYKQTFRDGAETRDGLRVCSAFLASSEVARIPRDGFTLYGGVGAGKTTLVVALARSLFRAGIEVRFWKAARLYQHLLDGSRMEELDNRLDSLIACPVLIIDDLGREKISPWWVDQALWPLVDERYGKGRPLIITTNRSWAQLEAAYRAARNDRAEVAVNGDAILDRLHARSAAVVFGPETSLRVPGWDFLSTKPSAG